MARDAIKHIRRQIRRANMTQAERKLRRDWLRAHMGKERHVTAQEQRK